MPDLAEASLALALPLFAVSAVLVWIAGTRITRYANVISERTGLGQALIGFLLLGGVTSLPELAVAVSASVAGDDALAVTSILGGVAMQVAILAVADIVIGRRALTSVVPDPVVFLQAGLKILALSVVTAALVVGDRPLLSVGLWMWLLLFVTGVSVWVLARVPGRPAWNPREGEALRRTEETNASRAARADRERSLGWAIGRAVVAGLVIVAAGYVLSRTGDAIATQTGLGQSFVGAVLLAIATSLPELSTVMSAMRAGLYTMAVSDIFGTNILDVSFLFVADLAGGEGASLNEVGAFGSFAALLGIVVTAIFVVGLAERRDRTVLRMGYDSLAVLLTYLGGLVVLYFLREGGS